MLGTYLDTAMQSGWQKMNHHTPSPKHLPAFSCFCHKVIFGIFQTNQACLSLRALWQVLLTHYLLTYYLLHKDLLHKDLLQVFMQISLSQWIFLRSPYTQLPSLPCSYFSYLALIFFLSSLLSPSNVYLNCLFILCTAYSLSPHPSLHLEHKLHHIRELDCFVPWEMCSIYWSLNNYLMRKGVAMLQGVF